MLLGTFIVFGGIFGYFAFSSYMGKQFMKNFKMPPAVVSAMPVGTSTWQTKLQATGSLSAVNGVDVTTEISGKVVSIPFDPGADVSKGDVLVELNAEAEIALLRALEAQAQLSLITYNRDKAQYEAKAIAKATVDADEADLKNKRALAEQQAAIVAKKTIKAPFAGRLGISAIDVGQYLNPGDKIVTLQSLDPIYLDFFLPQQDVPKIQVDQEVTLITDTFPGTVFKGKITAISPKVDPATRNVAVQATLPNPKGKLLPGMFGMVEILTGKPNEVLTLPQAAITYNPYGDLVYVLTENGKDDKENLIYKADQKFVTVGETRGDQVQVLTGLEKGAMVVTSGQMKLKNGGLAMINNSVEPGNNPNPELKSH
jgi:membrane fusion protein, multidrug efflux system